MTTDAKLLENFERLHEHLNTHYGSRTLYEALGVKPDATGPDIIRKFREKAFKYHPDRNKAADAEQRFKDVTTAYEILSDHGKRANYNNWLRLQGYQRETRQQPRQQPWPYSPQHNGSGGNFTGAGFKQPPVRDRRN